MIEAELKKISEKGLTSSNLDTTYKLIDMYKDCKTLEGMDDGYSSRSRDSFGDYSSRRYGRRYSGDYDGDSSYNRYMDEKRRYRSNKSSDCKERMMDSLDEYMDSFTRKMEELADEADCAEEKQTIERYINKIKSVR